LTAGLRVEESLVAAGDFSEASGQKAMRARRRRRPRIRRLTALRRHRPAAFEVRQPLDEMGRRMAGLLIRLIAAGDDGAGDGEQLRPVLATELVVRSSS